MKQYSFIFCWGMVISFLGSLPPGAINIAALQISIQQGKEAAIIYALGSMLAEVIVVRSTLSSMKKIISQKRLFILLDILTVGLLAFLTLACFYTAVKNSGFESVFPTNYLPPFKTGVLLSLLNPMHIPFWLGWTVVLINKGIITLKTNQFNWLVIGIGIGTISGFLVFIYTGNYLLRYFREHQLIISIAAGILLLLITLYQIKKMAGSSISEKYAKLKDSISDKYQLSMAKQ